MNGRIVTERLLASTSLAALMLAALGGGEAQAVVCTNVGAGASYNSNGSVPCVTVTGAAVASPTRPAALSAAAP